ncbi:MAG: mechanosensitive ion channel [Myxococcota bacterium]|nr:mechanosensitive ion channel [Myxococcota bacterium]
MKPLVAAALGAVLLLAPAATAQEPSAGPGEGAPSGAPPPLTLGQVEAELAALEADAGIEAAAKESLRATYKQAIQALKEAAALDARAAAFRAALEDALAEAAALRAERAALPPGGIPLPPTEDLGRALEERKAALDELSEALASDASEMARIKGRPFEISARLPELQREISEARKQLDSPRLAADSGARGRADRALLRATLAKLSSESRMLRQEQASQGVREERLQARQELLEAKVSRARQALQEAESAASERLASEARRVGELAGAMPEDLPEDDEAAQALALEVQALARELESVVQGLRQALAAQSVVTSRLERLTRRRRGIQEELELAAGSGGMAQVLLDLQRRLPLEADEVKALIKGLPSLDQARRGALRARAKRRDQSAVESDFADHPAPAVVQLVIARRKVSEDLDTHYGNLTRALAKLEGMRRRYLDEDREIRAFLSDQLFGFGMRSALPVDFETLSRVPAGLLWFLRGDHWLEVGRTCGRAVARRPLLGAGLAVALAALLLLRARIGRALRETATETRRIATDRYSLTGWALLYTVLLAAPVPLAAGALAWAVGSAADPSDWLRGLALGLERATWILLGLALLAAVSRPGGLGADHFRWADDPLARVRRGVSSFAWAYVPALVITSSGVYEESSDHLFGVGRFAFMLAHAWAAVVFWRLLRFRDGILSARMRERPNGVTRRWRYLWLPAAVALPLAILFIAGLGYLFTALSLSFVMLASAGLIAAGVVAYRLLLRWFDIKARKLALAEALERRRARAEAEAQRSEASSVDVVEVDFEGDEGLDLASLGEQTQDLLRLTVGLSVAAAVLVVWSGSFPIIPTLQAVPVPLGGGLTLLELGQAALVAAVTYIAVQNLPGLLELAILRASAAEAGTRNAISTLTQYAVIAIGLTLFFNVLEVDWAKLGWIAAALSVGIGFGLQEVVANFVCGLIVLFERPIRVGDFVTVQGVTGTVTKIQIRATTITNGERQDFIVPNKALITSSLLNWTRGATVSRLTIRVGVASEADPDEARRILVEVAKEHPSVLDDPAPSAAFDAFGDSSQKLVLYAFVPDIGSRSRTTTELHTRIRERFAEADIDMPNPQLDLRVNLAAGVEGGPAAAEQLASAVPPRGLRSREPGGA